MGFFIISIGTAAIASQAYISSVEDEVYQATYIVRGQIRRKKVELARDNEADSESAYTFYDFEVSEVLKGTIDNQVIRLRQPGGRIGDRISAVPGVAEFEEGEDVVVFLGASKDEVVYPIYGMRYGKFKISTGESGEEFIDGALLNAAAASVPSNANDGESSKKAHSATSARDELGSKWSLSKLRNVISKTSQSDYRSSSNGLRIDKERQKKEFESASKLLNRSEQAQTVDGATQAGRQNDQFEVAHDAEGMDKGSDEKMGLIPWIIGFFVLLIVPFFVYQVLKRP